METEMNLSFAESETENEHNAVEQEETVLYSANSSIYEKIDLIKKLGHDVYNGYSNFAKLVNNSHCLTVNEKLMFNDESAPVLDFFSKFLETTDFDYIYRLDEETRRKHVNELIQNARTRLQELDEMLLIFNDFFN